MPKYTILLDLHPENIYTSLGRLERLERNLGLIDSIVEQEIEKGCRLIAEYAQSYAPKRTGHMASQIQAERDKVTGHAHYTLFVELGHWTRGHRSYVRGQYFMRRALEQVMPELMQRMEGAVMALLRESE